MGKIIRLTEQATGKIKKEPISKNEALKRELWKRGYYVQCIGGESGEDIEYLIVSTRPPMPSSSN